AGASTGQVYTQTATDTWSLAGTMTSNPAVSGIAYADNGINALTARVIAVNRVNGVISGWVSPTFTNSIGDAGTAGYTHRMSYFTIAKPYNIYPTSGELWLGGKLQASNQGFWGMPRSSAFSGGTADWTSTGTFEYTADIGYPDITVLQKMPDQISPPMHLYRRLVMLSRLTLVQWCAKSIDNITVLHQ